ncbi:PAAR domain-containing protein [Oxalobacteraceae bacterium]|nr:PAAR domain-containing protein [Oxalobacteraceae bacterium]
MKNSNGKGVIRLGDSTSHGGKVISACTDFKALGKAIAVNGDMTMCPQCKGTYPIQVASSDRRHNGKAVAYDGNQTACGAKLISSIS